MKFILIFIPVLMAMAVALRDQYNRKDLVGTFTLCATSLFVLLRFSILAYYFDHGEHTLFLDIMEQVASMYIMPFTYMFLCDQCGTRWNNRASISLVCLPLLALLSFVPSLHHLPLRDGIVVIQCLTIAFCMVRLWMRIREYQLKFTKQMKLYYVWMALLLFFTSLSFILGMDRSVTDGTHWLFFIYFTLVITFGYLCVPYSFHIEQTTRDIAETSQKAPTSTPQDMPSEAPTDEATEAATEATETSEPTEPAAVQDTTAPIVAEVANEEEENSFSRLNEHLAESLHKIMEKDLYFLLPNISIDDVAQKLGTNRTYVTRLMRQEYGLSFIEYISVARIQHSQKLLYTSSHITLEEVALQSGFQSTSNYCRAFKRCTGTTPKMWLQDAQGGSKGH